MGVGTATCTRPSSPALGKETCDARQQVDLSEPDLDRPWPCACLGPSPSTARARQTEPLWRAYVRVGLWCNADRRHEGAHAGLAATAISPSTTSAVAGS